MDAPRLRQQLEALKPTFETLAAYGDLSLDDYLRGLEQIRTLV